VVGETLIHVVPLGPGGVVRALGGTRFITRAEIRLTRGLAPTIVALHLDVAVALAARRKAPCRELRVLRLFGRSHRAVVTLHHRLFDARAIGGALILPHVL